MNSSYITSAQRAEQLPEFPWPEVAFVGRSNCGKSSLLNALLGRNNLARESSTPGRTRMVNFFGVQKGEKQMILADLPGYGYAKIGREDRAHWQELVEGYLRRPQINELLFLMDLRRANPLEDEDKALLQMLTRHPNAAVTVVLTKADKVGRSELDKTVAGLKKELAGSGIKVARVAPVSSLKKTGIEALQKELLRYLEV